MLSFIFLASCRKNALDIAPQDRIAESAVWVDESLIKAYHSELYNAIPHGFFIHMYSKYTDEAYNSAPCCGAVRVANRAAAARTRACSPGGSLCHAA